MIPRECKRLIEVDFPIAVVSKRGEGKADPAWASVDATPVVGEAAAGAVPQ